MFEAFYLSRPVVKARLKEAHVKLVEVVAEAVVPPPYFTSGQHFNDGGVSIKITDGYGNVADAHITEHQLAEFERQSERMIFSVIFHAVRDAVAKLPPRPEEDRQLRVLGDDPVQVYATGTSDPTIRPEGNT